MHTSLRPAFDLARRSRSWCGASSGILSWIRQQAAERPTGAVLSKSPWRSGWQLRNACKHQVGKGHLPLLAEVQFCSNNTAVSMQAYSKIVILGTVTCGKEGRSTCPLFIRTGKQIVSSSCVQSGMILARLVGRPTCLRCGPFGGLAPCGGLFGSRQAFPFGRQHRPGTYEPHVGDWLSSNNASHHIVSFAQQPSLT